MIITKERNEKNFGPKIEFPKLIIEEESISKNDDEKAVAKTLSSREIITFLLFCSFFIVVLFMQLNIESSYAMNSAIQKSLASNPVNFLELSVEDQYWTWFKNFINNLYAENYYGNFTIPKYKRHAIPNLNVVISPIRITQRRMKMVPNEDYYTREYIKEGWASLGFDIHSSYDEGIEDNANFSDFSYNQDENGNETFYGKGGYTQIIDVVNLSKEEANQKVELLQSNGFTNNQTRSIVIDTVIYNQHTGFYSILGLIAVFEANGLITTKIELYNIKQKYYEGFFQGYFRLVCEICFCLLLIFYIIVEINEIKGEISNKKKQWEKERKREQARLKRKQEIEENKKLEEEPGTEISPEAPKKIQSEQLNPITPEQKQEQQKQQNSAITNSYKFIIGGIKEHYYDSWNWIDTVFLILSVIAVSLWSSIIYQHIKKISPLAEDDFRDPQINELFFSIAYKLLTYSQLCSINFIFLFLKVLKYLGYWFERVSIIFKTLSYAKSDIFYFLIMYVIIFFAFVVMCHIYYGADLASFGTILNSLKTLFLMLLGELSQLEEMIMLNKVLSFFFFIAFMTSMQFILINMFIAFLANAYDEVNSFFSHSHMEQQLKSKHFLVKIEDVFKWIRKRMTSSNKKKEIDQKKQVKAQEIIQQAFKKKAQQMFSHQVEKNKEELEEQERKKKLQRKSLFVPNEEGNDQTNHEKEADKKIRAMFGSSRKEKNSISKSSKEGIGNSTESNEIISISKLDELNEDDIDVDFKDESESEDHKQKSKSKQEEERAKIILTRMDWDKNFNQNQFFIEESLLPSLLSEKQDVEGKKERELKCGKIMWASITFTLYAALYINLILFQLNVERSFWYNTAMKNAIYSLEYSDSINYPRDITKILTYDQLIEFFDQSFIGLAEQLYQEETNFTGYYIKKVNYILGDKFRLCFKLAKEKDQDGSYFNSDQERRKQDQYQQNFIGQASQRQYNYTTDGYKQEGGFCQDILFDLDVYQSTMNQIYNDQIISDQLEQMSIEFVTFEASQYVHTYTSIEFNFPSRGIIEHKLNVFTMKLNPYKTNYDLVRLGFEVLYILLLIYNIFIFIKKLVNKSRQYERWKKIEIDTLSEIERRQRHQKKPEFIRKWNALFTAFTYFDLLYFSLAITSIVLWIIYVLNSRKLDFKLLFILIFFLLMNQQILFFFQQLQNFPIVQNLLQSFFHKLFQQCQVLIDFLSSLFFLVVVFSLFLDFFLLLLQNSIKYFILKRNKLQSVPYVIPILQPFLITLNLVKALTMSHNAQPLKIVFLKTLNLFEFVKQNFSIFMSQLSSFFKFAFYFISAINGPGFQVRH